MIKGMTNIKKAKLLNTELNMLDEQERDYIEKLANSLLTVQNTASTEVRNESLQDEQMREGFIPSNAPKAKKSTI